MSPGSGRLDVAFPAPVEPAADRDFDEQVTDGEAEHDSEFIGQATDSKEHDVVIVLRKAPSVPQQVANVSRPSSSGSRRLTSKVSSAYCRDAPPP